MPSSDSDDFESADEGHGSQDNNRRKKRTSSNYSDDVLHSEQDCNNSPIKNSDKSKELSTNVDKTKVESTDGWDDFDIDDNTPIKPTAAIEKTAPELKSSPGQTNAKDTNSQDTGWDDFNDWGEDDFTSIAQKKPVENASNPLEPEPNIKEVTDQLSEVSTKNTGWGWGWGVDSLLSTATASISTLTSQVSQGITTVLETGIGAPDPEELARKTVKEHEVQAARSDEGIKSDDITDKKEDVDSKGNTGEAPFPFGSLISGVTKFVETTGSKVITGGLDTLETIGKKTMEVLQDGDPGLAKKRALLGLDSGEKLVLSQVLREAKARAEEEDKIREQKREAKEVHYENLFDDFEGLVHLEALEMLSRQVNMRIEERLRNVDPDKRQEIKETLQQVAELCEMPEEEDDVEPADEGTSKPEALHDKLQTATKDIGVKVQFQPLIKQYSDILAWLSNETEMTDRTIYKRAVSGLAQATALSVEIYHKTGEMLLVKTRRSTADEADALTQLTVVLTKHIGDLANIFTKKLNSLSSDDKEQVNTYITNIFLEAGNSSTYIQNAFQLALPILQIGAV